MGRPTNAEIAAKKAAEEEKRKADALAQQINGAEESESDYANNANPDVAQDDGKRFRLTCQKINRNR